jgi:hypothetical protein
MHTCEEAKMHIGPIAVKRARKGEEAPLPSNVPRSGRYDEPLLVN